MCSESIHLDFKEHHRAAVIPENERQNLVYSVSRPEGVGMTSTCPGQVLPLGPTDPKNLRIGFRSLCPGRAKRVDQWELNSTSI